MPQTTSNATPPAGSVSLLIGALRAELVRALEKALQEAGMDLRVTQMQALRSLLVDGPQSPGELARRLRHDAGATTRLLDQLEERGYLRRQPDPADRRAQRIRLTATGSRLARRLLACTDEVLERAMSRLDAAERQNFSSYLQRMIATLRDEAGA